MNIEDSLNQGLLQDYCLGLLTDPEKEMVEGMVKLYPEVKSALLAMQQGLDNYVVEKPIWRKAALRNKIWETLDNINTEEKKDINNLPLINKYSDHKKWLEMVAPMLPATLEEDTFLSPIQANEHVVQLVTKSITGHAEEIHTDMIESFLILEGDCICQIGDNFTQLTAGGFIEIPLFEKHNVKVLSPYIVAIVQRIAV
ncbi:hypothetical protein CJD36_001165 [Flavipsychrobacter stenotrophus]|uniref:Cupin domain-containing protein n=1 Tax=Flavipsychrobacter stenotrophus TaxID=2077091 RepID=A0A2S7SZK8_9BACT|nr:hypothetical protein [Flavipsychrobacter stenotrophus]PQJ12389.1 hypothetical protein CJD36_001165 [Flavipsychrobacter stenotrophus]